LQVGDNDWLRLTGDDHANLQLFDGSVVMRRLLLAAVMFGMASCAQAADMPDLPILRGGFSEGLSTARVNWQGFYVGGQGSWGGSNMNFAGANDGLATGLFAYSPIDSLTLVPGLEKSSSTSAGFGGFTGYNWQWEDVVIGVEASYLHQDLFGSSNPRAFRYLDSNGVLQTQASSIASAELKDFGSLRLRGGYSFGSFLPYMFGGLAAGRADIYRSVSLVGNFDPLVTATSSQKDHFVSGYSFGLGMDVMLCAGLFMRLEYEYQRFTPTVDINVNTVRAGLGYKF
jgi:opacity protein-like surface antigen